MTGALPKPGSKRDLVGVYGMARAHAADACVQSDSIKGLAQSIAKPAYQRLLTAEPTLRRAVPTLIIAFLITICLGAFVQVIDQSRQKRASSKRDLAALADLLAERIAPSPLGERGWGSEGGERQAAGEVLEAGRGQGGPLAGLPPLAGDAREG